MIKIPSRAFVRCQSASIEESLVRARLERLAGRRVTREGVLVIYARRHRTQERNREDARESHPIPIHPLGAPWPPRSIQGKMLIAISESRRPRRNSVRYPVNAG
jgi:ribosome-associated protein